MLGTIVLLAQLAAAPTGYQDAMPLVEADETALPEQSRESIHRALSRALNDAVPFCVRFDTPPASFAIAFHVAANGRVMESWLESDIPVAKCVQKHITRLRGAWPASFYTSIKMDVSTVRRPGV